MLLDKALRLFLDSIGRREEYEFYLRRFRAMSTPAFGLLCPDRASLEQAAEVLAFDLRLLSRLDLHPMVMLSGREAPELLSLLSRIPGAFLESDLGSLWNSRSAPDPRAAAAIAAQLLDEASSTGRTPVLTTTRPLTETLTALVPLTARRVHFVRPRGPLRDPDGEPLFHYYTVRENACRLAADDRPTFDAAAALLRERPGTHISVTSPLSLLEEFFTVKGSGTIIRAGSVIRCLGPGEDRDLTRLRTLIEESFARKLREPARVLAAPCVCVERNYRGAALLEPHPAGAYLSKFAVGTLARGEGLAQELWSEIERRHPKLFWRARPSNPIHPWYERKAEGCWKTPHWYVYWRGVGVGDIEALVRYCLERPSDFC
jgi:hypothetical protein